MPTYTNTTNHTIFVHDLLRIPPNGTYETLNIIDVAGMTKTSDLPYYNPIIARDSVTATLQEITVDPNTRTIEIVNDSTVDVTIFLNLVANTPGIFLKSGMFREISVPRSTIEKLIFTFVGVIASNEFTVTQWNKKV